MTNLISHGRPMAELLVPRWKSQAGMYQTEFAGMTREPVTLEQLEVTREALLSAIREQFNEHREIQGFDVRPALLIHTCTGSFGISVLRGTPRPT